MTTKVLGSRKLGVMRIDGFSAEMSGKIWITVGVETPEEHVVSFASWNCSFLSGKKKKDERKGEDYRRCKRVGESKMKDRLEMN